MSLERIDKILSGQGFGSRKDVRRFLHGGTVLVNGKAVYDPAVKVDDEKDEISIDGQILKIQKNLYIMLNKPKSTVCSNKSQNPDLQTVFDLLDLDLPRKLPGGDLHCTGRLDADTTGLLLLTTDGALTHRLISPKTHVPKTYAVGLRDSVDEKSKSEYTQKFKDGIHIPPEDGENACDCQSAELVWKDCGEYVCELTIYEGKYHQVKRMFKAVGNEVVALKRLSMGSLKLDENLAPGEYRDLTEEELLSL